MAFNAIYFSIFSHSTRLPWLRGDSKTASWKHAESANKKWFEIENLRRKTPGQVPRCDVRRFSIRSGFRRLFGRLLPVAPVRRRGPRPFGPFYIIRQPATTITTIRYYARYGIYYRAESVYGATRPTVACGAKRPAARFVGDLLLSPSLLLRLYYRRRRRCYYSLRERS